MRERLERTGLGRTGFERTVAAVLIGLLAAPTVPVLAQDAAQSSKPAAKAARTARSAYKAGELAGDERILHALNRFTFGPRPGDLDAVKSEGLDKWFEQQLHPAQMNEAELNAKLEQFPAMAWTTQDLLYRYPSGAEIRQVHAGKLTMPDNPALKAIYTDDLARYEARLEKKEEKAQTAGNTATQPAAQPAPPPTNANKGAGKDSVLDALAKMDGGAAMDMSAANAGKGTNAMQPADTKDDRMDPNEAARILGMQPVQRVNTLGKMNYEELAAFRKTVGPQGEKAGLADLSPSQKEFVLALYNPQKLVVDELLAERLTRDVYASAQLREVMTDFWLNHFNIYKGKNEETPYYLVSYGRDVIRPLALGKFEDLLEATAHSPAMMLYLDNAQSMGPDSPAADRAKIAAARNGKGKKASEGLNENYARELMELHTLGVNGGYTQADVTEVARILTGWGVDQPQRGGAFQFNPNRHEPGTKKVMGKKYKENGEKEGRDLLHFLASNPATAKFLSRKLAVRFVDDAPPQALVDRMAKSYLDSHGDIAAVLRTMFHSPEFWNAAEFRSKVKTPLEYVASAARASGAQIDDMAPLVNALQNMGMPLYGCIPPTGYKWVADDWVSTGALVDRMNFALNFAAGRLPGVAATWSQESDGAAGAAVPGPDAEEKRLEAAVVAGGLSEKTRAALLDQFQQQIGQQPPAGPTRRQAAKMNAAQLKNAQNKLETQDQLLAGLLIGSPEFQRR